MLSWKKLGKQFKEGYFLRKYDMLKLLWDSNLVHFCEGGTKLKIFSEITPPFPVIAFIASFHGLLDPNFNIETN